MCAALSAGRHAVRVGVEGRGAGRRAAVLVPAGGQEGVFRRLPVLLLRPAAARRGDGDRLEAQPHGLLYAILHSGHEGVPQQGGSHVFQEEYFDLNVSASKQYTQTWFSLLCFYADSCRLPHGGDCKSQYFYSLSLVLIV